MGERLKSRFTVLIVDDDEDDFLLIGDALREALPGISSRHIEDGQALLDYLHQCQYESKEADTPWPDLILLDLNMPRMDGREALKMIKADERLKTIPVVVLTTSSDTAEIELCYRCGVNSFLTKPFTYEGMVKLMAVLGAYWFNAVDLPVQTLAVRPKLNTTVLVVDDSSFARGVLKHILTLAGHDVLQAENGEAALTLYRTRKPDLVLLDLALPALSGRDVLAKLQEIDSNVRVVITTADTSGVTRDELILRGVVGLLYKPFGSQAARESVESALETPASDGKRSSTGTSSR